MIYTFHRAGGFYPLELGSDEEARANAKCNPETIKVVNEVTGTTVWENSETSMNRDTRFECHGLDTPEQIFFYEQDFYVLSNFSAFAVEVCGVLFPTSEHAYHCQKFKSSAPGYALAILEARSAHEAFKIAEFHKADRRPDWDEVKVGVMRHILRCKVAQHEYVHRKLLATGDRELIENSWRDNFWGWGPNRDGQNMLGRLWMEIRKEIRNAIPDPDPVHG